MQLTAPRIKCETVETHPALPVIVVAAGQFSRMNGIHKQLTMLCGEPVLIRTLRAFDQCPFVSRIILVVRAEDIQTVERLCDEYGIIKLTDITVGGNNRHESVLNGFARLSQSEEKVLIHDGARPLVSPEVIARVVQSLQEQSASICAVPITDTVKRADLSGNVGETVDRTRLFSVQTPQGMTKSVYLNACKTVANAATFTDDAALLEQAGVPIRIVPGSPYNIKITTPDDLALAEILIKGAEL